MHIQDALDRFLVQLEADGRSPHTRAQYARHVRAFIAWFAPRDGTAGVDHEEVAAFLASLAARQRPDGRLKRARSMNSLRTSLRGFFGYLHRAGVIAQDPTRLVRRALCGPPLPRALSEDEQTRLLAVLDGAPVRDRMLFILMLRCGLRVGSAVAIDVTDVDLDRSELRLRSSKGYREERVPLPRSVVGPLTDYIDGRKDGPLFPGRRQGFLSVRHVQRTFAQHAAAAGIRTTRTHALRHSMATDLYRRTGDILLVQKALRHRSISSTTIYASVDDHRLREVMDA